VGAPQFAKIRYPFPSLVTEWGLQPTDAKNDPSGASLFTFWGLLARIDTPSAPAQPPDRRRTQPAVPAARASSTTITSAASTITPSSRWTIETTNPCCSSSGRSPTAAADS
jgi:hypothetical protein